MFPTIPQVILALALAITVFGAASVVADPPPEVAKLIKQLKDPDAVVRLKAAKELATLKDQAKDAIAALKEVAGSDPDEDVRIIAQNAVRSILEATENREDAKLVTPYLKALKSKKAAERIAALTELGKLGGKGHIATAEIATATMDPVSTVREAAAACLEKVDPTLHKHVITILYDRVETEKFTAAVELGTLGARAKGAVPVLKYRYASSSSGTTQPDYYALTALVQIVPDDPLIVNEIPALVAQPPGERFTTKGSRIEAGRAMGLKLIDSITAPTAKKVTALTKALADPQFRVVVADRLGKLGAAAKSALPALMKLKLDGDRDVRDAVTRAIEAITAE